MSVRSAPWFDPEIEVAFRAMPDDFRDMAVAMPESGIVTLRTVSSRFATTDEELGMGGRIVVRNARVPRERDTNLAMTILGPKEDNANAGVMKPCIYHIHGGGMVSGDSRVGIKRLLGWIFEFDIVVVSVDYRLAPENPYPVPVEDCYAGLLWTARNAAALGVDESYIVVAGGSAGGGLAAAMALLARDRRGPNLIAQMLMCPMLDDRACTSSSKFAGIPWDSATNDTAWRALLGAAKGGADVSPYAAPARAKDLAGLPPAYLDVGSAEVFRDETIMYASRLMSAGVPTELHVWAGGTHGFDLAAPAAEVSRAARAAQKSYIRRLLRRRT
jgi:acetyl esterase/lipase